MPEEDSVSYRSTGFEPSAPPPAAVDHYDFHQDNSSSYDGDSFQDDSDVVPMIEGGPPRPHSVFNPDGTSTLFTVFLIVNAALGAGLLNFPM